MPNNKHEIKNTKKSTSTTTKSASKRRRKKITPVKKTLSVITTTLVSLFLIVVITGSIVATALTIYIMRFANDNTIDVDLENLKLSYTSIIYGQNSEGEQVELKRLSNEDNRIWVDISDIPKHVQDAFVYSEDERFFTHEGVDWKRTFGAFVNMFVDIYGSKQGGSTITQQLIKNVTDDNEVSVSRKIREIFRSMNMEKHHTKTDILEAYMNYVTLNRGTVCGVEAAAHYYFDKSIKDVTIAEGATITAVIQNPNANDPYYDYETNRNRFKYVLAAMLDNGAITKSQYNEALAEDIKFADEVDKGDEFDEENTSDPETADTTEQDALDTAADTEPVTKASHNWYIDAVIDEVIADLAQKKGTNTSAATNDLFQGGYRIYTNVDIDMQDKIEERYKDLTLFSTNPARFEGEEKTPQGAFIVMDYRGNIKAVVGGIGERTGDRLFNRATQAERRPGSSIKPLATYAPAIELNLISWSTLIYDTPYEKTASGTDWPQNYSRKYSQRNMPVYEALQRSLNTIPVRVIMDAMGGPQTSYKFMTENFHISTLVANDGAGHTDIDKAPMAVGTLTKGLKLVELCAAYQPFGNGGYYYEPSTYSKVLDAAGNVVLEHNSFGTVSLNSDSAWVMNRLLQQVVEGPNGTAKNAKLNNVEVVAKTGTTDYFMDSLIVALTPEYVTALWYGFDEPTEANVGDFYSTDRMWKAVFGDIADAGKVKAFTPDISVVERKFCLDTGYLATDACTNTSVGYYKSSNLPKRCPLSHAD